MCARGTRLRIYAGSESAKISAAESSKPSRSWTSLTAHAVSSSSLERAEVLEHRVKAGETLYSIARAYGTTVSALRQSNPFLADRSLEAGDLLKIQR